ncbi:MAG TPA: helix-turn-helix domain-containing protein [Trebonia sp.]
MASFVAGLAPDSPAVPVTAPSDLAVIAAGLPPGTVGWAVALGRHCSDATRVSQGEHGATLTEEDTRRAIEGSMLSLLRRLHGDLSGPVLNEWQLTLARTMARLDWPYERYVLGLRLAQDMALEALLAQAVTWAPAEGCPALLLAVTHGVAGYFDDSVRAVITEFLAERQRAIAQSVAERRRLVAALVAGAEVPLDVAAATLGIDLTQHHLALVLWRPGSSGSDAVAWSKSQLELAVNRVAGRLRAPAMLTMPPDETLSDVRSDALLCWLTTPVPFSSSYLESLSELFAASHEIRVAVGVPSPGPAGFRRSHLASVDAYRVDACRADAYRAATTAQRSSVTGYAEVGVLALLSADAERTRWFVAEELGKLGDPGPTLDDLRETALCYLDTGRNLMDTARHLHVHRNTVVYRLAKIERLLGRPLDKRPFATQAALTLAAQGQAGPTNSAL